MQFKALCVLFFAIIALATPENGRRQEAASVSRLLAALTAKVTITATPTIGTTMATCLGGFDPPAPTLARQMLTALPLSVLAEIGNANSRIALASQFKAGQTPDWYKNLAPAIKSYVASVQTHATTGCSSTSTPTVFGTPGQTGGGNGGTGGTRGSDGVASSTSKALAARPTAALVGGLSGVLGMLGLLVVL